MQKKERRQPGLSSEELAQHEAADLPEREALTLVDPGTVLGGASAIPTTPSSGTPAPNISVPNLHLPTANPGGTYQPDTSASSHTT